MFLEPIIALQNRVTGRRNLYESISSLIRYKIMKEHTIKYFLDKYGTDLTTNFKLLRYAKELKIPNFHCIMRNEFRVLKKLKRLPIFIVCNYQATDEAGTHWIAVNKD